MPTVLRQAGFDFRVWPDDHTPPHVHVFKAGGEAKIELDPVRLVEVYGMSKKDAKAARAIVVEHAEYLLAEWRKFHA